MNLWALVVYHPHAQFIAEGWKWTETRPYQPRTTLQRGDDLVIVSARRNTLSNRAGEHWTPQPLAGGWRMRRIVKGGPHGRRGTDRTELVRLPDVATIPLVFGAAICVVRYDGSLPIVAETGEHDDEVYQTIGGHDLARQTLTGDGSRPEHVHTTWITDQLPLGIWTPGRQAWLLAEPRKLRTPVPISPSQTEKGHMQGLFRLDADRTAHVLDQLAAAS